MKRHDKYGPLLSALFEVSPSGTPGFVISTPKQTRAALGNSDSLQTIDDVDKALPRVKEKRRYGKEWSSTVPRNRRNTSLSGVTSKALPSPSSVSNTFVTSPQPMCLNLIFESRRIRYVLMLV